MRNFFFLSLILLVSACNSADNTNAAPIAPVENLEGYEIIDIPGTAFKTARKKSTDGSIEEEGQLLNGTKTGTWVTYHPTKTYPQKIITYTNGLANGPYFEFNNRGQMELKAFYRNNKLHGYWGQYSFGRPTHEANYKDGELDGAYREYKATSGKIQKEISYKDGKMHGKYYYYDEEGNVSLEYTYENGEKVD